jgi:hypothetical protein
MMAPHTLQYLGELDDAQLVTGQLSKDFSLELQQAKLGGTATLVEHAHQHHLSKLSVCEGISAMPMQHGPSVRTSGPVFVTNFVLGLKV